MRWITVLAAIAALFAARAAAQFDQNGPNAVMTMQGVVASVVDAVDHDVLVPVPGPFSIKIESGANPGAGIIMLLSFTNPTTGGTFVCPWGGTLDVGTPSFPTPAGIVLLADGIGQSTGPLDRFYRTDFGNPAMSTPPQFTQNLTAGFLLHGFSIAWQAIVTDPTNAPFGIDNTECGDANFQNGQFLTVNVTSTAAQEVSFLPGKVFNFHGVSYSSVWLHKSGFVTFGAATGIPSGGFTIDTVSWVNDRPSISGFMADWENPTQVLFEELGTGVRVVYGDPVANPGQLSHFGGADVNEFEIDLSLQDASFSNPQDGVFSLIYSAIDPNAANQRGDGMLGHTPGGAFLLGGGVNSDLGVPVSVGPGFAQLEEHNATGGNASVVGYDGLGTERAYNNISSWNGRSITFVPAAGYSIPGDAGYQSQSTGQAADDVLGVVPSSLSVLGGEQVTIVGKFANFNTALGTGGSVVFNPTGTPLSPIILGILDGTGTLLPNFPQNPATSPFRDGEGLVITTPAFSGTGPITMQVTFANGAVFSKTVNVVVPGQIQTTYSLPENGVQSHSLVANQISFYGVNYTTFFIHAHGYVTFNSGFSDFSENINQFFAGWQGPPTTNPRPGVAVMWSDLNRNSNPNDTYSVLEDTTNQTVSVTFANQAYWTSGNPAGTVSITFGDPTPGSVAFDYTQFTAATSVSETHDVILGISDGNFAVGPNTNLSNAMGTGIANVIGSYMSTSAPDSIGEIIPRNVQPPLGAFQFVDIGNGMSTPFGTWLIL